MLSLWIGLHLIFGAKALHARNSIDGAPEPLGDFSSIIIPLKKMGSLILVEATVDSISGYFIFDTGAPSLILNSKYFSGYSLDRTKIANDIAGRAKPVKSVQVGQFRMSELYFEDIHADLADLSNVEEIRETRILGAVGVDLFFQFELLLDLGKLNLGLYRLDAQGSCADCQEPQGRMDYLLPFKIKEKAILVDSRIRDYPVLLSFDTGAETLVLGTELKQEVYQLVQLAGCVQITGANGSTKFVHHGRLAQLWLGRNHFNANVIITSLKGLERSFGEIDGIVGLDLFGASTLRINFVKKEISVWLS